MLQSYVELAECYQFLQQEEHFVETITQIYRLQKEYIVRNNLPTMADVKFLFYSMLAVIACKKVRWDHSSPPHQNFVDQLFGNQLTSGLTATL